MISKEETYNNRLKELKTIKTKSLHNVKVDLAVLWIRITLSADPDSTSHPDADPDPDSDFLFDGHPDPSFKKKAHTLEKVLK